MAKRNLFIAGLENLRIKTAPGRGDRVGDLFLITSDSLFVKDLLPQWAHQSMGSIEVRSLLDGRPVAYVPIELAFQGEDQAHGKLIAWLRYLNLFLHHIWFVKDHAINTEMAYACWWQSHEDVVTTRSYIGGVLTTTSDGTTPPTTLEHGEFTASRELFLRFLPRFEPSHRKPLSRLDRAFYFIQAARASNEPAIKVANYCTALEALFSNDSQELSHKLAERISWMLCAGPEERLDTFRRIKAAYGVRSKVVHGSGWQGDSSVPGTSRYLDQVLRTLFVRLRKDDTPREVFEAVGQKAKERHEEFCQRLSLGVTASGVEPE